MLGAVETVEAPDATEETTAQVRALLAEVGRLDLLAALPVPDDEALDVLARKAKPTASVRRRIVTRDGTEQVIEFRFVALAPWEYDRLRRAHAPSDAQRAVEPGIPWDTETFPQALVAACIVAPPLSVGAVNAMWRDDAYSTGDLAAIFSGALTANIG